VLAPGLSSVLTVGSTEVEVGVDDDDNVCVAQKITLGLTADPTVVDAFVAGEFLQALSALISDLPGRALATNEL
jgi:pyruvate/2-oxoglutarate dehydrogenase complex dihydrolipoamide acyltransferase (E2) component